MIRSAEEMKQYSFQMCCLEILVIARIIKFIEFGNGFARNEKERAWKDEFLTPEGSEALQKKLEVLRVLAGNLREEIAFSQKQQKAFV